MAIVEAPRFFGGTRGWINIMAGDKYFVQQRTRQPYALASGSVGLGDIRPFVWPFMIFDFVPSLAIDLLLLPISIPHFVGEGLDETRRGRAEQRRLELRSEEDKRVRSEFQARRRADAKARDERRAKRRRREARQRRQHERSPQRPKKQRSPARLDLDSGSSQGSWVARHNSARAALAEIAQAQGLHRKASPSGEFSADLNALLARGTRRYRLPAGFEFRVQVSGTNPTQDWIATASPKDPGELAARWFAVDSAGVVKSYREPFGDLPWDCTLESLEAQRSR